VAILLIANAIWVWRTGSRLEKKLAALRAEGEPLSLADLARKAIPPQKNAAVFLRRATSDLEAMEKEWTDVYASEGYESGRFSESELKTIRSTLETYPKVIPLLEQAAACPDYDPQLDYTLRPADFMAASLPDIKSMRGAVRILRFRVLLLLSEGQREEAMRSCLVMFRLCRHFDHTPILAGYLVSLACRSVAVEATNLVLRAGPLSKDSHEALEAELALHDSADAYKRALKAERAYALEFFRTMPGWCSFWLVGRPLWNDGTCYYLDMIDRHMAVASRPYSEVVATTPAPARHRVGFRVLTDLVVPAIVAGREAMERTRAAIRCLRVLNALQARPEQGAAETPKLSDLGLPADATTDPFTGKPLHLKKLPAGWLVYSVGKDLKDDGGDFTEALDVGVGPPQPPAGK
jgi:hypothetical protein